jgi:hypothetical protein
MAMKVMGHRLSPVALCDVLAMRMDAELMRNFWLLLHW